MQGGGQQLCARNYMQNPHYFMFASLALSVQDKKLHVLKDKRTKTTTGSMVSSLYYLKDLFLSGGNGTSVGAGWEGGIGLEGEMMRRVEECEMATGSTSQNAMDTHSQPQDAGLS
jgi:hypothetical protein